MNTAQPAYASVQPVPHNEHVRLPRIPSLCTGALNRLHDACWEARLRVKTSNRRPVAFSDAHRYESVPYCVNFKILDRLAVNTQDVLVDLGSGEGRMLFAAALRPLRGVVGVEIDPDLHACAEANLCRARGLRAPIHLHCQSATTFDFTGVTVICFFNPFGGETMREVLGNLRRSLDAEPRRVKIAYINPVYGHLLAEIPWLQLVDAWAMSAWSRVKAPIHFYEAT